MVNENTLELINVAIDGEASAGQQAELAEILGRSDEARAEFEALSHVVSQLESVPEIAAPPVREPVMERLRSRSNPPAAWRVVPSSFGRRQRVMIGWAVAASIVVVAVLFPMLRSTSSETLSAWQISGSMAPVNPQAWEVVATAASPGGEVSLVARRFEGRIAIQPTLRGAGSLEVRWLEGTFSLPGAPETAVTRESSTLLTGVQCTVSACPPLLLADPTGRGGSVTVTAPGVATVSLSIPPK